MKWVIEKTPFIENAYEFEKYCDVIYVKYRPFDQNHLYDVVGDIQKDHPAISQNDVIFYGSINLGRALIHQKCGWQIWLPDKLFDCNYWMPRFEDEKWCYNDHCNFVPFGMLKNHIKRYYDKEDSVFIRPNSGYKLFTGHTIDLTRNWDIELNFLKDKFHIFPEDLIMVSSSGRIDQEYRLVVESSLEQGSRIIAGSKYKDWGESQISDYVPISVMLFANKVLKKCDEIGYSPVPAWTLDICVTNDIPYILELGSFSSAGLYACDIEKVVESVETITKEYLNLKGS